MRFRFTLEKALEFARLREIAAKGRIASMMRVVDDLRRRRGEIEAGMREQLRVGSSPESVRWSPFTSRNVPLALGAIRRLDERVLEQLRKVEAERARLNALILKRKGLESFREKKWEEFRVGEARRLQKGIDELYRLIRSFERAGE